MVVADTNLWARAFLNDDASQSRKARKALADARSKGGVFVPLIIMAELAWVLRGKWETSCPLHTRKPASDPRCHRGIPHARSECFDSHPGRSRRVCRPPYCSGRLRERREGSD